MLECPGCLNRQGSRGQLLLSPPKRCVGVPADPRCQVHALCTGYSRHPAFLLRPPLVPRRSSVCSGCAEGNGVVTGVLSERVCSLPGRAEGPCVLC